MNRETLKHLAESVTEKEWPAVLEAHLAEQRAKTTEERIEELEASMLLMSVGFLRMERTLTRLVSALEKR